MIDSIAAASMSMSAMRLQTAYDTAILKKTMEGMEQEILTLIENIAQSTPTPPAAPGHIDTYI